MEGNNRGSLFRESAQCVREMRDNFSLSATHSLPDLIVSLIIGVVDTS